MNEKTEILVVEDQAEVCFFLENVFSSLNMNALTAATLLETETILKKHHPSTIIIDNKLPDGLGFEFIPKIKEHLPQSRIIAITGLFTPQVQKAALLAGADVFLKKPFTVSDVYNAVFEHKKS